MDTIQSALNYIIPFAGIIPIVLKIILDQKSDETANSISILQDFYSEECPKGIAKCILKHSKFIQTQRIRIDRSGHIQLLRSKREAFLLRCTAILISILWAITVFGSDNVATEQQFRSLIIYLLLMTPGLSLLIIANSKIILTSTELRLRGMVGKRIYTKRSMPIKLDNLEGISISNVGITFYYIDIWVSNSVTWNIPLSSLEIIIWNKILKEAYM